MQKTNYYEIALELVKKLKARLNKEGKTLIITEESYTSKCDALCLEKICKHEKYLGKRIQRGLFKSGNGKVINADLNGAINIFRKKCELTKITGLNIYNPEKIKINL